MRLIVITPQVTLPSEPQLVNGLLAGGLRTLHVRKPQASAPELAAYVQQVVPEHRRRLVLHAVSPVPECNGLAREHGLGGVHYPERLRPSACGRLEGLTSSAALHSLQDLDRDLGALDYVFLSPIFDSISKAGYAGAFDREALLLALPGARYPVIALGGPGVQPPSYRLLSTEADGTWPDSGLASRAGVAAARLTQLHGLAFAGVAVIGAVWEAPDPLKAYHELAEACAVHSGAAAALT